MKYRFAFALSLGALCVAAVACQTESDPDYYYQPVPYNPSPSAPAQLPTGNPATATVDSGQTLLVTPGTGAGVYVEYNAPGSWHIWSTCDTVCHYRIRATPVQGSAAHVIPDTKNDASGTCEVSGNPSALDATLTTPAGGQGESSGTEGFRFEVSPSGASVEVEVELEGSADPHVVYWIGGGVLHNGAPTDPIILAPSAS